MLLPAGQYTMWPPGHLQSSFHPVGYWSSGESQRPAHMTRTYQSLQHTDTRLTGVSVQTILETARYRHLRFPAQGAQSSWSKALSWVIQIPLPITQIFVRAAW